MAHSAVKKRRYKIVKEIKKVSPLDEISFGLKREYMMEGGIIILITKLNYLLFIQSLFFFYQMN